MKKHNMDLNQLIDELIELSDTKYGQVKVGLDTLNTDILFIKKFGELKDALGVDTLNDIDLKHLPKIKDLKEIIEKINSLEKKNENRNLRMKNAANAYKKR